MSKFQERKRLNKDLAIEDQVYGVIYDIATKLPCCLSGHSRHECKGPVTGHHIKTVGSGGVDFMNTIPVCMALHWLMHGMDNMTMSRVEKHFKIDLGEVAKDVTLRALGNHPDDLDY